jgi:hypothetical protein
MGPIFDKPLGIALAKAKGPNTESWAKHGQGLIWFDHFRPQVSLPVGLGLGAWAHAFSCPLDYMRR